MGNRSGMFSGRKLSGEAESRTVSSAAALDLLARDPERDGAGAFTTTALSCLGLRKAYPGVVALDDLDFQAPAGHVHAILGENGAGKSTFIKILGGAVRPERGRVELFGKEIAFGSVRAARRAGISVAYQESSLVPDLSVAQSIWLHRIKPNALGLYPQRALVRRTEALCEALGAPHLDVRCRVRELSIAQRHLAEIVASVARDPRVLVLDEATAALPAREAEWTLSLARMQAAKGTLVLFISHRLRECRAVADSFTIMRRGRAVRTGRFADAADDELVDAMLGRKPRLLYPPPKNKPGAEIVLSSRGLEVGNDVRQIDFDLRQGEILGVGGLEGQGQAALLLALFGMRPYRGTIRVSGKPVTLRSPRDAFQAGIGLALVPEDRRYQGLFLDAPVRENIVLPVLSRLACFGLLSPAREVWLARRAVESHGITLKSIEQNAGTLSGGNQQKVVIAKLLSVGARILLFYDLTRGIDVGTKAEIFALARDLVCDGHSILIYSSESQELVNLCDRIMVLRGGKCVALLEGGERTESHILQAALDIEPRSAVAAEAS